MNIRLHTLWRVPVFCAAASWISFYLTIYLGRFLFVVQTKGADGVTQVSADPIRTLLFHGVLFLLVLLLGGLWFFRSMTKAEIAVSAAITAALYLAVTLLELCLPDFPVSLSIHLSKVTEWTSIFSSLFLRLTGQFEFSVLLSGLAPFLFVPFGGRAAQ